MNIVSGVSIYTHDIVHSNIFCFQATAAGCAVVFKHTPFAWWENRPVAITHNTAAKEAGILALEYHAPNLCVRAADLEAAHNCMGRYTQGRGQEHVGFCSDDEDAVSMSMTVFAQLMNGGRSASPGLGNHSWHHCIRCKVATSAEMPPRSLQHHSIGVAPECRCLCLKDF